MSELTLIDYEKWLQKIKDEDDENEMEFVWSIMKSPYIEYHYSLLKRDDLDYNFKRSLLARFDEHGSEGRQFLLSLLERNEDVDFQGEIIFMLGLYKKAGEDQAPVREFARKLVNSGNSYTRDRAIIVLGWIGTLKDIDVLANLLFNDSNAKCRGWVATSFMHMGFRLGKPKVGAKALPYLAKSIGLEQDYFSLGCMILSLQELTGKKMGLSQKSVDEGNKEKIQIAKEKALRFFKKQGCQILD